MRIQEAFTLAARTACRDDGRTFQVGAVARRADGKLVVSRNLRTKERDSRAHAEARLARKLDVGSTVWVARIGRGGEYRMARPCANCRRLLLNRGVRVVYYTINEKEWGVIKL